MRNQKLIFSQIFQLIWMKYDMLLHSASLLKLMLNLFGMINIQGRELCLGEFIKCNTGMHLDTY